MDINAAEDFFIIICKVTFKDTQHRESLQEEMGNLKSQYNILPLLLPMLKKESIEFFAIPTSKGEFFYQWHRKHKLQCEDAYFEQVPFSNIRVNTQNRIIFIFSEKNIDEIHF